MHEAPADRLRLHSESEGYSREVEIVVILSLKDDHPGLSTMHEAPADRLWPHSESGDYFREVDMVIILSPKDEHPRAFKHARGSGGLASASLGE